MFRRRHLGFLVLATSALLVACGDGSSTSGAPPTSAEPSSADQVPVAFADRDASGEELADAWFGLLALTGPGPGQVAESPEEVGSAMALVKPYLDPAFTLVRATGQRYNAGNYVPLDVDEFEISDVVVTEPRDDVRVVRYFVTQPGATAPDSGVVLGDGKAPRISVFRWDDQLGHW
ncbi:MAG: hypothetical protein FGM58_06850, partial [Acidimicrobiia bacterium]|nr:hypothetical protein [Acidimicrobiia bacterium]